MVPPQNADTTIMKCIQYSWTPYGGWMNGAYNDFEISENEITVATSGDSVYLKILNIVQSYKTREGIKTWIRGVREGNKLRFKDNEVVGYDHYDVYLKQNYLIEDSLGNYEIITVVLDSLINNWDTIYQKSVLFGKKEVIKIEPGITAEYHYADWPLEYLNDDILADYNPVSGLIRNPNHELLVRPLPQYYPTPEAQPYITNRALRDEMAIKDFIIGRPATKDPDYLPAPEVEYYKTSSYFWGHGGYQSYSYYVEYNIYMDITTDDGELLDCNRLYAIVYIDDIPYGPYDGLKAKNPFKNHKIIASINYYYDNMPLEDWKERINKVEVMVYYEKEDGTRIESPRVRAIDVSGVKDIQADLVTKPNFTSDENIYDLTGRIVNPENLSPGLYIQRGRKFIVS